MRSLRYAWDEPVSCIKDVESFPPGKEASHLHARILEQWSAEYSSNVEGTLLETEEVIIR